MKRIDAVYALILDQAQTKILMVKNVDNGQWTLPGGAVEQGEFLEPAVIREAKEETGYEIRVHGIVAVNEAILLNVNEHACFFTFRAEIVRGTCEISRPKEIGDVQWINMEEADTLMPYYKNGLKDMVRSGAEITYYNQGQVF